MITDKRFTDTLSLLVSQARLMSEEALEEALKQAQKLNIPLERAIVLSGQTTEASLKTPLRVAHCVQEGKLTLDQAVNAIRLVAQQDMSVEAALAAVTKEVSVKQARQAVSITSEIGQLLLDAHAITQQQLQEATQRAQQAATPVGRMLRLKSSITNLVLSAAINGQILIQEKKAQRQEVVESLQIAHRRKISIEQALFEMGRYKQPGDNELKLSDLFAMARLISESDRLECLELEVVRRQPLGQLLLDQGLVSQELLESAIHLQGTVATDTVRAYQAATALWRMAEEKISVYQALAELRLSESSSGMRLGDLLVAAEFATMLQIESAISQNADSSIKVGKILLKAGIINEHRLLNGLRCQSLIKFGFLSDAQAIAALRGSERCNGSLEEAFAQMDLYAPSSMQWSWI